MSDLRLLKLHRVPLEWTPEQTCNTFSSSFVRKINAYADIDFHVMPTSINSNRWLSQWVAVYEKSGHERDRLTSEETLLLMPWVSGFSPPALADSTRYKWGPLGDVCILVSINRRVTAKRVDVKSENKCSALSILFSSRAYNAWYVCFCMLPPGINDRNRITFFFFFKEEKEKKGVGCGGVIRHWMCHSLTLAFAFLV